LNALPRVLWLLPAAFIIHDGEEVLTMPAWIARNRDVLERIAQLGGPARRAIESLPVTTAQVAAGATIELIVLSAATLAAARARPGGAAISVYAALLAVFVGHSATHLLQAVIFRGYTPGVVTAALVIPPVGVVLYRRLLNGGLLTARKALVSGAVGVLAFGPLFFVALALARLFP
jgi:hypothetical protein